MDYYKRYHEIVADYNREKDRATIEDTFAKLIELVESLDEEPRRAAEEGFDEDELALFDLLKKDKLDGRIDTDFFDRKAAEWREEQGKCLALIREHQDANQTYLDEGIRLLELAQKAGALFREQSPAEKRRLLGFVLSNCAWKDGQLTAAYRQPFDLLAKNVIALESKKPAERARTGISENWLPELDSNQ
ncbi:MAG: DUF3387 domain-containing protein [Thiohalocapsa sp.]